jgi:transcription initiation factor TFIID subunit 15
VLDGSGSNFDDEGGYGRARRPIRKERDDKVHDSIIEERIQRERPCRTLFIRNIKASLSFSIFEGDHESPCS